MVFSIFRFLVEFNLYSWWHSDLTAKGKNTTDAIIQRDITCAAVAYHILFIYINDCCSEHMYNMQNRFVIKIPLILMINT